jgi:hypothetical protein
MKNLFRRIKVKWMHLVLLKHLIPLIKYSRYYDYTLVTEAIKGCLTILAVSIKKNGYSVDSDKVVRELWYARSLFKSYEKMIENFIETYPETFQKEGFLPFDTKDMYYFYRLEARKLNEIYHNKLKEAFEYLSENLEHWYD